MKCVSCGNNSKDLINYPTKAEKIAKLPSLVCKKCFIRRKNYRKSKELRKTYNITYRDHENMKLRQKGICMICKENKSLVIDHCHKSGKVRDLLCNNCNAGLGFFKENQQALHHAIEYLSRWNSIIEKYFLAEIT